MTELARLSQILINESLAPRASLEGLRRRNRTRHIRRQFATVAALAVVVVVAFSAVQIGRAPSTHAPPSTQLTSYFEAAVNVSNVSLSSVGLPSTVAIPDKVTPSLSTVGTNGVVSYVGAEYCPYCALQRWALLVALSKFGTFTHLDSEITSSSSDVYPHVASWSFLGATYSSKYFVFEPVELTSSTPARGGPGGYQRLERMSAAQDVAYKRYDTDGSIPFVDVGNHYVTLGASSSPSVLEGLTLGQIGNDLNRPQSAVARAIDGSANYLIAALCTMTQESAPTVCSSSVIRSATRSLNTGVSSSTSPPLTNTYPTQPPTNAPIAVWKKWSVAEHRFWLHTAATFRPSNPECTVTKISVTGRKLSKPLFGIPTGVWLWGMGLVGHCPPGASGGLTTRSG